jgi:glycine/D-amino acid oxidase-like deaminating enzyme
VGAGPALKASVPPGLATPWWIEEALAAEGEVREAPALRSDAEADVAVVGGGFTGLWTALALVQLDPQVRVVVLEAKTCGEGPSGRNGGFLHGYWAALSRLRERFGADAALEIAHASSRIVPGVREFCERRGEDTWFCEGGMLKVSTSPSQDETVERPVRTARELGVPKEAEAVSAEDVQARCRSPRFRRGVFFRDGATVQPARLVRALRRAALEHERIDLHERTPALRLRADGVETEHGRIRIRETVVATNAAATGWRPLARRLTNFGSYVVLTEPVPELLEEIGWTGGEAIADGRMFLHYFRTTNDGRVLMGSGSGPIGFRGRLDGRFTRDEPSAARAESGLRTLLPGLHRARVTNAWGGPIDVSADYFPFFGTVPGKRVHYGAGYSGNGVGPSWLGGQILARLALGIDDELTRLALVNRETRPLPPEPVKRLGGGLVRAAVLACEEAEEQGRRPPLAARAGAVLPRLVRLRIGTR